VHEGLDGRRVPGVIAYSLSVQCLVTSTATAKTTTNASRTTAIRRAYRLVLRCQVPTDESTLPPDLEERLLRAGFEGNGRDDEFIVDSLGAEPPPADPRSSAAPTGAACSVMRTGRAPWATRTSRCVAKRWPSSPTPMT